MIYVGLIGRIPPILINSKPNRPNSLVALLSVVLLLVILYPVRSRGNVESGDSTHTLSYATWNVNRLQSTDTARIQQIAHKLSSFDADIYALQEVSSDTTLNRLLEILQPEYKGFIASYIPYQLRLAFLYKIDKIDSVSSRPLPVSPDQKKHWAHRMPFIFTFDLEFSHAPLKRLTALNIHAKADIPNRYFSYRSRMQAADGLYQYLGKNHTSSNLIILGDFNDDIDLSIYQNQVSPYYLFRSDHQQYRIVSEPLSDHQLSTTIFNRNAIDHIIVSDELFSASSYQTLQRIPPFKGSTDSTSVDTLSDHYMVSSELHMQTRSTIPEQSHKLAPQDILKIKQIPNPVHEHATFNMKLSASRLVSLGIYNMTGQLIKEIISKQKLNLGSYHYRWIPSPSLANGMYYYMLQTDKKAPLIRPLLLLR